MKGRKLKFSSLDVIDASGVGLLEGDRKGHCFQHIALSAHLAKKDESASTVILSVSEESHALGNEILRSTLRMTRLSSGGQDSVLDDKRVFSILAAWATFAVAQ